jgi:Ca-activated chloride channel family protein
MTFENPAAFLLLYALIPVIILMIFNYKRRFVRIYSLISPVSTFFYDDISKNSAKTASVLPVKTELRLRYAASSLFFIVFFICVCLALAGPRFGILFVRELRQGADVVLAFDLSRSMNAKDASPLPPGTTPPVPNAVDADGAAAIRGGLSSSRLERSIYTARALLKNLISENGGLKNLRLGVALGKGEAVLAIPLTDDPETVFTLLDSLSGIAITSRGTNLEKLLNAAAGAFQDTFPSSRTVILFSDGETLAGSIPQALERLRAREIKLFTVGAGSVYGAPVPDDASFETINTGGKQPVSITSFLMQDVLSSAAEKTGGSFIDGNTETAITLAAYIKAGGITASDDAVWTFREESGAQWHLFVLAGLAALILSKLCSVKLRALTEKLP